MPSIGNVTDLHVVRILRPFVHATHPVLEALRESDPFGLKRRMEAADAADSGSADGGAGPDGPDGSDAQLDDAERGILATAKDKVLDLVSAAHVPGTPAWAAMGPSARADWWVGRVGRFTSLVTAVPGLGGALADRLPVQDMLGAASQGLLLCAIAGEHGVDEDGKIRLLAHVLFERDVRAAIAESHTAAALAESREQSAELTAEITESKAKRGRVTVRAAAGAVWRLGRLLWGLGEELEKRPQGRWWHQAIGMLPVVGAAGDYFGERSALKRAARAAHDWIAADRAASSGPPPAPGPA